MVTCGKGWRVYREVEKEKKRYTHFFKYPSNSRESWLKTKDEHHINNYQEIKGMLIPVMGLSLLRTEEGLLISARNLYKSSSLSLSPSLNTHMFSI